MSKKKVRAIKFSKNMSPEEVAAIMEKYRPDRILLELPSFKLFKNSNRGQWYAYSKCSKCGEPAIQPVSKLVNYNLGCASCLGERNIAKYHAAEAVKTIKRGRVPFNRKMTPEEVAAIMKEHRPDRKMLGLPYYKSRLNNKKRGDWHVKTECGHCGHIAPQNVRQLVNDNLGCKKCKHGRLE